MFLCRLLTDCLFQKANNLKKFTIIFPLESTESEQEHKNYAFISNTQERIQ